VVGDTTAALGPAADPLLEARQLSIAAGGRLLVRDLCLDVQPGEFIAVLGRNGCGKSLTLHAFAGLNTPAAGEVLLCGTPLTALRRMEVARRLALLPQDREDALAQTTLESALVGRHPHLSWWQPEGSGDRTLALAALERLGVAHCADRQLNTLSGGEQRRAAMATLLAQQPRIYLLDEPTNHLDPHHQIEMLQLFRGLTAQGVAVIATLHDPTLAERYADRALLLHGDGRWQIGAVAETLTAATLSALYLTPVSALAVDGRRAFVIG
jgi:iron complex transport system ATP-binding protein